MKNDQNQTACYLQKGGFCIAVSWMLWQLYQILQTKWGWFKLDGAIFNFAFLVLVGGIAIITLTVLFCNACKVDLLLLFSSFTLLATGVVVQLIVVSTLDDAYLSRYYCVRILENNATALVACLVCVGVYALVKHKRLFFKQVLASCDLPTLKFTNRVLKHPLSAQTMCAIAVVFVCIIRYLFAADWMVSDYLVMFGQWVQLSLIIIMLTCVCFAYLFTDETLTPKKKCRYALALLCFIVLSSFEAMVASELVPLFILYLFFVVRYLPYKYTVAHSIVLVFAGIIGVSLCVWSEIAEINWCFGWSNFSYLMRRVTERIYLWVDPSAFLLQEEAYQILQSATALWEGGIFGLYSPTVMIIDGLGSLVLSSTVLYFGIIFACGIVLWFLVFFWRCMVIAADTYDKPVVSALCGAFGVLIFAQMLIHAMMSCGLLPIMGLELPFFSLSGLSVTSTFAMVSFILYHSNKSLPSTAPQKPTPAQCKKRTILGLIVCLLIFAGIGCFGFMRVKVILDCGPVLPELENLEYLADQRTAAATEAAAQEGITDDSNLNELLIPEDLAEETINLEGFAAFEALVWSQIDASADLMLASIDDRYEGDILAYAAEYLTLDSMTYGSFSGSGANELLFVYSVNKTFHAAGYDRKMILLFDTETNKLLVQYSFGCDLSDVYILESDEGASHILCIGNSMSQGVYWGDVALICLEGGVATSISVPGSALACYDYNPTTGLLQVQEVEVIVEEPLYAYNQLVGEPLYFVWNPSTAAFEESTTENT